MKKSFVIFIVLLVFYLSSCSIKKDINLEQGIKYKSISMEEAIEMMQIETGYIILDVRTPEEFTSGHIPNAINIPNEAIDDDKILALPDKNQLILVYCRSGNRSKQASEKLVKIGYTNIVEFGGINDWPNEIEK